MSQPNQWCVPSSPLSCSSGKGLGGGKGLGLGGEWDEAAHFIAADGNPEAVAAGAVAVHAAAEEAFVVVKARIVVVGGEAAAADGGDVAVGGGFALEFWRHAAHNRGAEIAVCGRAFAVAPPSLEAVLAEVAYAAAKVRVADFVGFAFARISGAAFGLWAKGLGREDGDASELACARV